jgi:glycosyltransferase involved in cell wall biosynthesis
MPTLNRAREVELFLESLKNQTFRNFELIIIDQNDDDRLFSCVEAYRQFFTIVYNKNNSPGLSKNRNIGLTYAHGDVIAFPDDDCEYKTDTLQTVNDFFSETDYDFLTLRQEEKMSGKSDFKKMQCNIVFSNVFRICMISFTIFARRTLLINFKFDEQLGIGARYGSGEESDMIAYFLKKKVKGFYDGNKIIYHPVHNQSYNNERAYNYVTGFGALHKKLFLHYKQYYYLFHFIWMVVRNIAAIIITRHKRYYISGLQGKLKGFFAYRIIGNG